MSATTDLKIPRWKFWLRVVAVIATFYFVGYFVLMDRHLPTSPFQAADDYFESSFRWAAKQRAGKKGIGPQTQFPEVTIWNVIYRPLDRLYFRVFPRRGPDLDRLRALGYYYYR